MNRIIPAWETGPERANEIWGLYESLIKRFNLCKKLESNKDDIRKESEELGEYLYPNGTLCEENLFKLLKTYTDRETLEKDHLIFNLSKGINAWEHTPKVFNYTRFSSLSGFKSLVMLLSVETCPYCNRAFTSTVKIRTTAKKGTGYLRQNQLDHYKNKNNYPYLALTLPNLIPVCGSCNLHKSDSDEDVLYPYKEGFDDNYRFVTHPVNGYGYLIGEPCTDNDFKVEIEETKGKIKTDGYKKRIEKAKTLLGLGDLYTTHNHYVATIFRKRYIFGEEYIDDLYSTYSSLFSSKAEVREMMYMKSIEDDKLYLSPLSRLTRDVDYEITRLNRKEMKYE